MACIKLWASPSCFFSSVRYCIRLIVVGVLPIPCAEKGAPSEKNWYRNASTFQTRRFLELGCMRERALPCQKRPTQVPLMVTPKGGAWILSLFYFLNILFPITSYVCYGKVLGPLPSFYKNCYKGNVTWLDSLGNRETKLWSKMLLFETQELVLFFCIVHTLIVVLSTHILFIIPLVSCFFVLKMISIAFSPVAT